MFKNIDHSTYVDLSSQLRDGVDWNVGILRFLNILDVTTVASDPLNGLLAFGTIDGILQIFGGPGVHLQVNLSEPARVKFVQFSIRVFRLVCVDERDRFYVWDLETYGQPKLLSMTGFSRPINALTLSPSHTHAFLALDSGEIRTYDLLCIRKSPYSIPNMWTLYEKKQASERMGHSDPGFSVPVDIVIHPRNLNLIFVAYGGGVILCNLTERSTVRVYEYTVPAGAPGGQGYSSSELLTHRQPTVTAIVVHPSGHLFVVGYSDGCIVFWAVEDEDQPILARTLDDLDVNKVDGEMIQYYLPSDAEDKPPTESADREPIFKLAWSGFSNSPDPRGGSTALTILGGQKAGDQPGISVFWLPAFNPSVLPAQAPNNTNLHPDMKKAMHASCLPASAFLYPCTGLPQEFLLISKDSPHFAGAFDASSILILSDLPDGARTTEAFEFPPPEFQSISEAEPAQEKPVISEDELTQELASALQSMQLNSDPRRLHIPYELWNGSLGIINGQLFSLERETYDAVVAGLDGPDKQLPLRGGVALIDGSTLSEAKISKFQPHRILVTYHRNLSIHFQDISAQLLLSSPMQSDFPHHLSHLSIDVSSALADFAMQRNLPAALSSEGHISSVHFATETLECVVTLQSGELILFRFSSDNQAPVPHRETQDQDITVMDGGLSTSGQKFKPYIMLQGKRGAVTACAPSDIGFLAIAYSDGALLIIDLRGPEIILNYDPKKSGRRNSGLLQLKAHVVDPFKSLVWTFSAVHSDPHSHIRLVAVSESGSSKIFTLVHSSDASWSVESDVIPAETVNHPIVDGTFVIDSKRGALLKADRHALAAAIDGKVVTTGEIHSLWITCGLKGAKCIADLTGERLGKLDWSSKYGVAQEASVIERSGSQVLVVFTDKHFALVCSLPNLELLHTLNIQNEPYSSLSVDDTGDYVQWIRHPQTGLVKKGVLGTLFNIRRAYGDPEIDLTVARKNVPPQPQPVSMGPPSLIGSWFTFGQSLSGDQIDALLAGPDRPVPKREEPKKEGQSWRALDDNGMPTNILKTAQETQTNLYNRLAAAVSERGQRLGNLEDSFNSLEEGSKNMVSEAKRLAAQQTAKKWLPF